MQSVLVVDDYARFRALVRPMLERAGFRVVGEAEDGDAAMAAVLALRPDVVLLDIQLRGDDGFALCERMLAAALAPVVVLTSGRPISTYRRRLARSGARGFIPKSELTGAALAEIVGVE